MTDAESPKDELETPLRWAIYWADTEGKVQAEYLKFKHGEPPELPQRVADHVKTSFTVDAYDSEGGRLTEMFGTSDPNVQVGFGLDPSGALVQTFDNKPWKVFAPGTWDGLTCAWTLR